MKRISDNQETLEALISFKSYEILDFGVEEHYYRARVVCNIGTEEHFITAIGDTIGEVADRLNRSYDELYKN